MDVSNVMNDDMPVVADISAFDKRSGNRLERLIFNHRAWVLLVCLLLTAFFAVQLRGLELSASFEKMLPQSHPYIQNYLANRGELRGLGDSVRIVVENPKGDVFDKAFLERFGKLNDEVFLLPGVDRAWMRSIWSPVVRWTEVTEEGFSGGPVLPERFDGSPAAMDALRLNVARAGIVGSLVAEDYRSIAIVVPLLVFVVPIHITALAMVLTFATVMGVTNHMGWEMFPRALVESRIGHWLITASHHHRHHEHYRCNYGLYFRFWDHLCGTDRGLSSP